MNSWKGLLLKEFRFTRMSFFITLLLLTVLYLFINFNSFNFFNLDLESKLESRFLISFFLIALHVLYLPSYIFSSLHSESKQLHLWLHNPQSSQKLLLAKLFNGLFALIISLVVSCTFGLYSVLQFINIGIVDISYSIIFKNGLAIVIHIVGVSIYLAIFLIFVWVIYQVAKKQIGKFSWLIVIATLIIPTWILEKIESTKVFNLLTQWGKIDLSSITNNFISEEYTIASTPSMYVGIYVFYLIIIVGLFFLSSWLIDKKVEV